MLAAAPGTAPNGSDLMMITDNMGFNFQQTAETNSRLEVTQAQAGSGTGDQTCRFLWSATVRWVLQSCGDSLSVPSGQEDAKSAAVLSSFSHSLSPTPTFAHCLSPGFLCQRITDALESHMLILLPLSEPHGAQKREPHTQTWITKSIYAWPLISLPPP